MDGSLASGVIYGGYLAGMITLYAMFSHYKIGRVSEVFKDG